MISVVPFHGWEKNLRVSNGHAEVTLTLEVGPRIVSYTKSGGFNPLKIFPDQAGLSGESNWRIRGGHRFWVAPEDRAITYMPDNAPVAWKQNGELSVTLTPPPETAVGLQKELTVTLAPTDTRVTVVHTVTRIAHTPLRLAPWALTVMTPGGVAVIPQPELGEHPRDLLPNRAMILWPYTDLSDPRWKLGQKYFQLRQSAERGPTKLGLSHSAGWCAYLVGGVCFLKRYAWHPDAAYPDGGCNFETFTNAKMLEIESLGPLVTLAPGQSAQHIEEWELHEGTDTSGELTDAALDSLLSPIVSATTRA